MGYVFYGSPARAWSAFCAQLRTFSTTYLARARVERIIQRGKDTFVEVGTALSEIRASRLCRSSHETFEAYFQERLGLEKSHVKQLMDSAKVINNLKTSAMAELPNNERQARPLAKLPAEES